MVKILKYRKKSMIAGQRRTYRYGSRLILYLYVFSLPRIYASSLYMQLTRSSPQPPSLPDFPTQLSFQLQFA
ncbi:hypothetical protein GYMLUDRAFT_47473 [Collybiopsis luxurians FD-317 M1]|uniref:Uncharacterized protein n=1 Tax=Collybiopsis luxurians FD-317 M1 TaxID=944289 RepID=A0A0D0AZ87_9AGAR|nr:hypothetical protein GYMLUDRAFT_47473 [Collybiopsis luxurians FD-317 M1]